MGQAFENEEKRNHIFRFLPGRKLQCRGRRDAQERPCSEHSRIESFRASLLLSAILQQQAPVGAQQLGVVFGTHGAAEKIALHDVAALIAQEARLFHGLHAFGHH